MVKQALLILFTLLVSSTFAQDNNANRDSINLDDLLLYPKKNSLPVRKPIMQIQPVEIPVLPLDLKVNYWKNWVTFGINVNQASFTNNWSGGGVNSIAFGTNFNYKVDYTKENLNYVSEVIFQYGKLKNRNQLERKTNDRIFWDNKLGFKFSKNWNFFGSVSFESQFDNGYSYSTANGIESRTLISQFMAPGYLTESLGFEYKPNKFFWLRIGTGTARQTFVLDKTISLSKKNYGVDPGKRFRNELAFQLVSSFEKDIAKNVNLKSRYSMFANYEHLNNVDHRLDATLTARINRFVNTSINTIAIYDDDASTKIQASQALSLGLIYKFPN
jgi:hypothetical protein